MANFFNNSVRVCVFLDLREENPVSRADLDARTQQTLASFEQVLSRL